MNACAIMKTSPLVGMQLPFPGGEAFDKSAHVVWELRYQSEFGPQRILVEASVRPVLRAARRVRLGQVLGDPLLGEYGIADCWAIDAAEARAEKVRAAFTREAIRDFYDLDRLADTGADFTSAAFIALVDAKLKEFREAPPAHQPPAFALNAERRRKLERSLVRELPSVLRAGSPDFHLDAMLDRFNRLWGRL